MNTILIIIIIIFSSHLLMTTIPTPAFSVATNDPTGDRYIATNCLPTSGSFILGNSNYSQSLMYVVDDLSANAPKKNGFLSTSRDEDPTNYAHGLALCRGDVSMDDCKTCLINATMEVVNTDCRDIKSAVIWRDHCMLKYSNILFIGQIDTDNIFYSYDDAYASQAWNGTFENTTQGLLNGLINEAAINEMVPLFAHGNKTYGDETVYAMVQCTRDLAADDCTTNCLNVAITRLSKLCLPRRGGRVVMGSCMTRYEMYPFLKL